MLKHQFALWAMCLVSSVAFAQTQLTVRVQDSNNYPITGATVSLSGNSTKSTDQSGTALFTELQSAIYELQVSHLGFETVNRKVSTTDEIISITLTPSIRSTGEVFVSATRAGENSATTFKNVAKEDLRKTNLGQDIPFLLDQTPGVVIGSDAGAGIGYTNMTIRGRTTNGSTSH